MTEDQEETIASSLERIAAAMSSIARTYELMYYKAYPPARTPRDIALSRPATEEEKLKEAQGATGEKTTEAWMTLDEDKQEMGSYERAFVEEKEHRTQARQQAEIRARTLEHRPEET